MLIDAAQFLHALHIPGSRMLSPSLLVSPAIEKSAAVYSPNPPMEMIVYYLQGCNVATRDSRLKLETDSSGAHQLSIRFGLFRCLGIPSCLSFSRPHI
jgi:hypothetical protein